MYILKNRCFKTPFFHFMYNARFGVQYITQGMTNFLQSAFIPSIRYRIKRQIPHSIKLPQSHQDSHRNFNKRRLITRAPSSKVLSTFPKSPIFGNMRFFYRKATGVQERALRMNKECGQVHCIPSPPAA